jgi:prolipoprotein diacylglyceryltransferase
VQLLSKAYMYPVLFSFGPVIIYTANVLYVLAWCVFSFLFWRSLRSQGMLEERIFDLTFYSTIIGFLCARLGFVFLYPSLFTASILLIGAIWVQPGLWIYSGMIGAFFTLFILSKRLNIRFANVFDAFVLSLSWACIPVLVGVLFQGAEVGKESTFPWAVLVAHHDGRRHPVQIYEIITVFLVGLFSLWVEKRAFRKKWPEGLLGALILVVLTPALFVLEMMKEGQVYLYGISVNQWLLIVIFAESCGSVIVKGNLRQKLRNIRGGIYEWSSKRASLGSSKKARTGEEDDTEKN